MGHGLENSTDMVYREANLRVKNGTPWHRLGQVFGLDENVAVSDAINRCGASFEATTRFLPDPKTGQDSPVRVLERGDNGKILDYLKHPSWTPIQNSEALGQFQPAIDKGEIRVDTAGVLHGGQCVWLLCEILADHINNEVVPNDPVQPYVILSNWFQEGKATRVGFVNIRTVCANTEHAATMDNAARLVRCYHSRNAQNNVKNLIDGLDYARKDFALTLEKYQAMAKQGINREDLRKYVRVVLDLDPEEPEHTLSTNARNKVDKIERLFDSGQGNNIFGVKGTVWAAYNAITEYYTHQHGRNDDTRLDSLWFGSKQTSSVKRIDKAFDMALNMTT
jgi:phage/plasmid-like protein (TIGR03299 family)